MAGQNQNEIYNNVPTIKALIVPRKSLGRSDYSEMNVIDPFHMTAELLLLKSVMVFFCR